MRDGVVVSSVVVVAMASGKSTPKNGGRREGNEAVLHDCKPGRGRDQLSCREEYRQRKECPLKE